MSEIDWVDKTARHMAQWEFRDWQSLGYIGQLKMRLRARLLLAIFDRYIIVAEVADSKLATPAPEGDLHGKNYNGGPVPKGYVVRRGPIDDLPRLYREADARSMPGPGTEQEKAHHD